jgi:hypothetical protein
MGQVRGSCGLIWSPCSALSSSFIRITALPPSVKPRLFQSLFVAIKLERRPKLSLTLWPQCCEFLVGFLKLTEYRPVLLLKVVDVVYENVQCGFERLHAVFV